MTIGINISGAEYSWMPFASSADLDYLESEGVTLIRLPISWERMQPTLNGALDPTYLAGLESFLNDAAAHGMQVVVDLHNYGRYNLNYAQDAAANYGITAPNTADATAIGTAAVPISSFANFWGQLATALNGQPGVAGYDIMNEPNNLPSATTWPTAAQAAVNAIRTVDMNTPIYVEGYQWASAINWVQNNANLHIVDPANKIVYEAHLYFDTYSAGQYTETYTQQGATPNIGVQEIQPFLQWLQANNYQGFVGEFGVPGNDPQWIPVLNNFMNAIQAAGVSGTMWTYVYSDPSGKNSWWPNPNTVDPMNIKDIPGVVQPQLEVLFAHTAPTVTSFSPDTGTVGDSITSANVVTLTGTAASNSTVNIFDGTTQIGTATANSSGAWSLTTGPLSNGAHAFAATQVDAAGTISEESQALSVNINGSVATVTTPTIASFSTDSGVVGDHITNDSTLTLAGTAEANSTVKVFDGTTQIGTATANGSGAWSYVTAALTNGAHSLTATATDAAGNTSTASAALAVTIDTTAPVTPTIASFSTDSGVVGDHITNDSTLTLAGTAEANSTVKVFDGTTQIGTATANGSGAWSYVTATLTNGAHSLTATATDAAGNTSTASAALAVTIDTTAPGAPVIASDAIVNSDEVKLTGTAEANSTVAVFEGTTQIGTATTSASGAWSYTTGALPNGAHAFTATATDIAGNTSLASQAIDPTIGPSTQGLTTTVIEAYGSTSLTEVGSNYFLDNSSGSGPELKFGGAVVVAGQFTGWTPIGAEQTATGYEVAWKIAGTNTYTVWTTDSNGNYISDIGHVSGTSAALETLETSFHQDLNGDGQIGPSTTVIEAYGSTSLTEVGSNYFLDNSSGSGPELKFGGAVVVAGQFTGWTPIGAEQTATGYEVAWKIAGTNTYTVWTTDSNGNYISDIGHVSGTSAALETLETSFHQDLNGDGQIGPSTTVIEAYGSTSLTEVGSNYFLDNSSGSGPELKFGGAVVVAGQFTGWTPIGAEQTATGYEVAWKIAGTNTYTVWTLDSNGNYISDIGHVSGTSAALETLETSFHQDLNGDGQIGPSTTVIEAYGSTSLTEVGSNYFLDNSSGSGPELKFGGAVVVAGQFTGWTPIGAEQTATGYEVAWKIAGTNTYTVWTTDSNGNYISDIGHVSGTSAALETLETSFHQDLNGDGQIGPSTTVIEAYGSTSLTEVGSNYFLDNSSGSGPELKFGGAVVVAGQFTGWTPIGAEQTATGYEVAWKIAGTNTYTVWTTDSNGNYISDIGHVSGTSAALESLETSFHQDLNSDGQIGPVAVAQTPAAGPTPASIINGTTGNDTLTNTAPNQTFYGNGGNDTFVFTGTIGKDTIADFQASNDVIQLSHNTFASVADVLAHAAQVGADVTVTIDPSNSITLHNTAVAQLTANNFHLV